VIYNESISGDFANSGLTPTGGLVAAAGSNQIFGTTGNTGTLDRDYFTVTIPTGLQLNAITVLPGTTAGNISFIGMQAGNQVTLPTNASTATGLLGWWHYGPSDINDNLLPPMSTPANGSSGFTIPLGAGNYSFWIQDFTPGTFTYGFDFAVAAAPEPATWGFMVAALTMFGVQRRFVTRSARRRIR